MMHAAHTLRLEHTDREEAIIIQGPRQTALFRAPLVRFLSLLTAALLVTHPVIARAKDSDGQPVLTPSTASTAPQMLPSAGFLKRPSAERPPFFEVSGGPGAKLFLFGTIHLGPKEGWTYPRHIRRALKGSETLVMELDLRLNDEETVSQAVIEHVLLPDGTRLSAVIGPETSELITKHDDVFRAAGLPFIVREGLRPWFIATSLTEVASAQSGFLMTRSADDQIMATLGAREFFPLETIEEQLGFFNDFSMSIQELILKDTLERWDESVESVQKLVHAWQKGDEKALVEFAREGIETTPELEPFFKVLLDDRNVRWTKQLVEFLESPEREASEVFVAVGAFHLLGPGSLPKLLEQAGYTVKKRVR